jgi:hypothetical protein
MTMRNISIMFFLSACLFTCKVNEIPKKQSWANYIIEHGGDTTNWNQRYNTKNIEIDSRLHDTINKHRWIKPIDTIRK